MNPTQRGFRAIRWLHATFDREREIPNGRPRVPTATIVFYVCPSIHRFISISCCFTCPWPRPPPATMVILSSISFKSPLVSPRPPASSRPLSSRPSSNPEISFGHRLSLLFQQLANLALCDVIYACSSLYYLCLRAFFVRGMTAGWASVRSGNQSYQLDDRSSEADTRRLPQRERTGSSW